MTGLDSPLVQVLLQTQQPSVGQFGVAAVRVRALFIGRTGVGVVVRQEVVLGGGVDGAVDWTVGGRRAAFLRLVRVVDDPDSWNHKGCVIKTLTCAIITKRSNARRLLLL